MKHKRIITAISAIALALTITACSSPSDEAKFGKLSFSDGETAAFSSAIESNKLPKGNKIFGEAAEYNSLNDIISAIQTGVIDSAMLPSSVADYAVKKNPAFSSLTGVIPQSLQMAVTTDNAELQRQLNDAIKATRADGTLSALLDKWVYNGEKDKEPDATELAVIDEATKTIKVGVTGDLPPLDYITADGKPSGFNVEFLSAIAKQLGVNIELVTITAETRTTALASEKIDVIFWVRSFGEASTASSGLLLTDSYFDDSSAFLAKKENLDKISSALNLSSGNEPVTVTSGA